jgi:hypothetical protein
VDLFCGFKNRSTCGVLTKRERRAKKKKKKKKKKSNKQGKLTN